MPSTSYAKAMSSALALLIACAACAVGEPLVDRAPHHPPRQPSIPDCLSPSELCFQPVQPPAAPAVAHTLGLSSCRAAVQDPEGDAFASCQPPAAGLPWQNRDVRIATREPREVVISGVDVTDVRIHIEGPVTLIVRDVAAFRGVQLSSTSPDAELVLDGVEGSFVMVGDAAAPFSGHVFAHESRLDQLSMVAASVELDSTMITESFISATVLSSGDGFLRDVMVETGDALFAPSRLERVRIARCGSLSFFGGELFETVVPRCDGEPTRLYDVEMDGGILDGRVRAEWGVIRQVQLGRVDDSDFELWDVATVSAMFCDAARSLRSTYGISCSDCTELAFGDPDDVCNVRAPDEDRGRANHCEVLDLRTECSAPLPDRMRPLSDYWL